MDPQVFRIADQEIRTMRPGRKVYVKRANLMFLTDTKGAQEYIRLKSMNTEQSASSVQSIQSATTTTADAAKTTVPATKPKTTPVSTTKSGDGQSQGSQGSQGSDKNLMYSWKFDEKDEHDIDEMD